MSTAQQSTPPASTLSPAAAEAAGMFTTFFNPPDAAEMLWQLLVAAIGSPHASGWSGEERTRVLLFYRLAGDVLQQLPQAKAMDTPAP